MTSTQQYTSELNTALAGTARTATEKSVQMWKQGAQTFGEQAGKLSQLPKVDMAKGVERYFDFVQRTVEANRELAAKWAELVTSITGVVYDQAKSVGNVVAEQVDRVVDLGTEQAHKAEQLVREQADQVEKTVREQAEQVEKAAREQAEQVEKAAREQAEQVEKAEQDAARAAKAAERKAAKEAHDKAREPYEGLTKAELSDLLAERDLPKSGNLDELVERLVEADSK